MKITVSKKETDYSFSANEGERILYAGLRQGLSLPHECATGTCGSCKAALKSGQLRKLWPLAPGAKSFKPGRDEFLMCQSAASSDCEIGFRGKLEIDEDSSRFPDYHTGHIIESELLTRDVVRFTVRFEQSIRFRAGQFVVMNIDGLEGGRAYSMVNCDEDEAELEFVIKRLPGGGFSEWLFSEPRQNAQVSVFGPLGRATLDLDEAKNIVCITGGSGIAGILSLLTEAVKGKYFTENSGHLFFGVRTHQDLFFHNRLIQLGDLSEQILRITFTFSQGVILDGEARKSPNVEYLKGDVNPVAMDRMQDYSPDSIAFLAGPPPMVDDAIRKLVIDKGFSANNIRYDKFG